MGRFASAISTLLGVLSIVVLVKRGFAFGFSAPLEAIIEYYGSFKALLFGWAEPWVERLLVPISKFLHWNLLLHPHWRDFYLLLQLYFSADVAQTWRRRFKCAAIYDAMIGFFIALGAAIACGTQNPASPSATLILTLFPICGILFYGFLNHIWNATLTRINDTVANRRGFTWWEAFGDSARYDIGKIVIAGFSVGLAVWGGRLPVLMTLSSPGLAILCIFTVLFATYHVILGERYRTLGLIMFWVIGGAVLFILMNAGLKFVGL